MSVAAQINEGDRHRIAQTRDVWPPATPGWTDTRAAPEAGTDPRLVQQWIAEVQAERTNAERALQWLTTARPMIAAELQELLDGLADIAQILRRANAEDKADLYKQLGLRLRYEQGPRLIKAEAEPSGSCTKVCPRGELNLSSMIRLASDLQLTSTGEGTKALWPRPNQRLFGIDLE